MSIILVTSLVASEKDKDKQPPVFTPEQMKALGQGGAGSDVGMKAGLMTSMYIGNYLAGCAGSVKATMAAATAKTTAFGAAVVAKGTAVGAAVVAAPATPWVVGGAVVTYGGYKTYRYFNPTQTEQAKSAELERKREEDLEHAEMARCKRERAQSVKGLRDCVHQYRRSRSFTASGLPRECEDHESRVSLHEDGDSEVVSMAKRFVAHAPLNR